MPEHSLPEQRRDPPLPEALRLLWGGSWMIYNEDTAGTRVSPDSTYKIYDALLGLEKGIITPEDSGMAWDGTEYSIDA